jgi:small subunit ribosomal protein S8
MLHETVDVPASNIKSSILEVFKNEGFIADYKTVTEDNKGVTTVTLKYIDNKERVIKGLKRVSKPGLRVYVEADNIPKVLNGLGVAVISTSKGVMTDKAARKLNLGGEVLAYIW